VPLSDLSQPEFIGLAQGGHDIPPNRVLRMQLDPVFLDRGVDHRLDPPPPPVAFRRRSRYVGAETIGLVNDKADHLRHPLEGRADIGRERDKSKKILQESALKRQGIFTAHLQIENIDLVS